MPTASQIASLQCSTSSSILKPISNSLLDTRYEFHESQYFRRPFSKNLKAGGVSKTTCNISLHHLRNQQPHKVPHTVFPSNASLGDLLTFQQSTFLSFIHVMNLINVIFRYDLISYFVLIDAKTLHFSLYLKSSHFSPYTCNF